jgi:aspartate kinase
MPDLIKVAKFGGTSMADVAAMRRCANIIKSDSDKRLIVVSATSGTTNLLTSICRQPDRETRDHFLKQIRDKHITLAEELSESSDIRNNVDTLLHELESIVLENTVITTAVSDTILSFGERLSSTLFTQVLIEEGIEALWIDVRDVMITDDMYGSAEPHLKSIRKKAEKKLMPLINKHVLVTQGFIGADKSGNTTTLGRGGSDYSAALLAEAVDAEILEIWTDVTAIYTTDPRLVPDARPITEITFDEAAELSVFGAKVLHPATLKPAIRKSIKVYVGSSMQPEKPGTWIVKTTKENPSIRAISLRRNQTLMNVHSLDMLHRHGFLARLFQILAKYKISVDLVTTSEVSVSLTIDTDIMAPGHYHLSEAIMKELQSFCEVKIEQNLSLIALVGSNLDATSGVSGPIFSALEDVNIRLICHGASPHNLCFLVNENQAEGVVKVLHKKFITDKLEKVLI